MDSVATPGTVSVVARTDLANERLAEALSPYVEGDGIFTRIVPEVLAALGAPPDADLRDPEYPVVGLFLDTGGPVFSLYLVTPGRFIIYQLNAEGTGLTIVVPLERLRQIEHRRRWATETRDENDQVTTNLVDQLIVEVDAQRTYSRASYPDDETAEVTSVTTFTTYVLIAGPQTSSLEDFARALSNVLGH